MTIHDERRLTAEERSIADTLGDAWLQYRALAPAPPDEDQKDFARAIHECQRLVAYRVAQRCDPGEWR
jgi:hypothetical protein